MKAVAAANVTVIPAKKNRLSMDIMNSEVRKLRVAAYARVSTNLEEQLTSYEAQVDYYTRYIQAKEEWEFVEVYTDEGISATNTKKRDGFNRMVADALSGKIDLIITKSISRFARNTVDTLTTVRKLKEKGIEVFFEKENIRTLDGKGELLITIMSSLAQEESRSISENVTWGQTSITNILNNEVYLGKIRWRYEPTKRIVKDGMIAKKRYANENYELHDGLHETIITEEQWRKVKEKQKCRNHSSVNKQRELMNPFATILVCEKCGAIMKRNVPGKSKNTLPWYRCPTRGCDCRSIKCNMVEDAVLKAMQEWFTEYTIKVNTEDVPQSNNIEIALSVVREQLSELHEQQDKICELLEKGVYTVDMFSKRNSALEREIRKLQSAETDLLEKSESQEQVESERAEVIPATQHILDSYEQLSIHEKNRLWKIVMEKITVYRTPDGKFSMHIYPKLPM